MKKFLVLVVLGLIFTITTKSVSANHSWNGYHWARTANPFTLKLADNLTSNWDPYLFVSSTDSSTSTVLDTTIIPGTTNPKNCRPTSGRVEVCNAKYGNTGWLGIAQVWVNGDGHISQGTTKMNDTYFNTAKYNTPSWRQMVVCQEIAHTFGLDHQDEIFDNTNLNTCMDYTNNPNTNQHPNQHDYDELVSIYSHLDSYSTISQTTGQIAKMIGQSISSVNLDNPGEWGRLVKDNGKVGAYERDFGFGNKVVTHVIWAD